MSMRHFLEELETAGILRRLRHPVSCIHELGALTREVAAPALFERICGYPDRKIFVNGLADIRCIALALGLHNPHVGFAELARIVRARAAAPLPPTTRRPTVETRTRTHRDLSALPVPWWHHADVGRYLGTWHLNITTHPRTGTRNVGVYRMQLVDDTHTTVSVSPRSHLAAQMQVAEQMDRPLAMAVAIGVPEAAVIAAAAALPPGIDELGFAGSLLQHSLDVCPCQTIDQVVPVNTEIVLEGVLLPHVRITDGPFMDYTGVADTNHRALLFELRHLSMRPDAIFRGTAVGRAGAEDHVLFSVLAAAGLVDFHGAPARTLIQSFLLRHRLFRVLQSSGRVSKGLHLLHR